MSAGSAMRYPSTPSRGLGSTPGKSPGSGLRGSLGLGLGGGLAQLSASLAAMPAARTHTVQSAEATSLLRSIGYHDTVPLVLSSLYKQEEADSKPVADDDEATPLEYEKMTALVAERLDRLSRLTTDNFLRAQAELDWEEERASLVGAELDSLHLGQRYGVAEGGAASCNPIAGFTLTPLGSGQRSADSNSEPWRADSRLGRLGQIVEKINCEKWAPVAVGVIEPLKELSDTVGDKTLDTSEESETAGSPQSPTAQAAEGMHWRYLGELYRILHSIISPLHALEAAQGRGSVDVLSPEQREALLVRGALQHLHSQFRGMLLRIRSAA